LWECVEGGEVAGLFFWTFPAGFALFEAKVGGRQVRTLTGHSGIVFSVAFSRDGNRVVSGSDDNLVKIWDTETGGGVSSHGACTWCSDVWDWVLRRASRGVRRWARSESGG